MNRKILLYCKLDWILLWKSNTLYKRWNIENKYISVILNIQKFQTVGLYLAEYWAWTSQGGKISMVLCSVINFGFWLPRNWYNL